MSEDETRGGLTPIQDTIAGSLILLHEFRILPPHLEERLYSLGHPRDLTREKVAHEIALPPTEDEKRVLPSKAHLVDQLRRALGHPRLTRLTPREAEAILNDESRWVNVLDSFLKSASSTKESLVDPNRLTGPSSSSSQRSAGQRVDWQVSVMVPLVQLVEPGLHRD